MFYNSTRRHSYFGYISSNEFEKRYNEKSKIASQNESMSINLGSFQYGCDISGPLSCITP